MEGRELNIFGAGDGDGGVLGLRNAKISPPAFAGFPYMVMLR